MRIWLHSTQTTILLPALLIQHLCLAQVFNLPQAALRIINNTFRHHKEIQDHMATNMKAWEDKVQALISHWMTEKAWLHGVIGNLLKEWIICSYKIIMLKFNNPASTTPVIHNCSNKTFKIHTYKYCNNLPSNYQSHTLLRMHLQRTIWWAIKRWIEQLRLTKLTPRNSNRLDLLILKLKLTSLEKD